MRPPIWWLILARLMRRGIYETPHTAATSTDELPANAIVWGDEPIMWGEQHIVWGA